MLYYSSAANTNSLSLYKKPLCHYIDCLSPFDPLLEKVEVAYST